MTQGTTQLAPRDTFPYSATARLAPNDTVPHSATVRLAPKDNVPHLLSPAREHRGIPCCPAYRLVPGLCSSLQYSSVCSTDFPAFPAACYITF
ncbi:hypothetical protein E2C01_026257 [Portunus trituberculatus]|uniref:Uncharacterized protein n=1 Tax=Portunus trituberculatus TaxID=210409 RepID=A0A5B7EIN4_PORTR|nr:hypothetical protein [Portunus trituberculatus]